AIISGTDPTPAAGVASVGLQRQKTEGEKENSEQKTEQKSQAAESKGPCLEEIVGEDIPSLFQAGVLTIIEFGGASCKPCQRLKAQFAEVCAGFEKSPPPVKVRIYSIDI